MAYIQDYLLEEIRRQLPYPTESEAREKHGELTRRRKELLEEIGAHESALREAKESRDRTAGGLKALRDALPDLEIYVKREAGVARGA